MDFISPFVTHPILFGFAFVQVVQSIGDRSLNSIDEKFIVAGGFLKKFMNEPGKLECLKAFADSLDIVEWILKETKGICALS